MTVEHESYLFPQQDSERWRAAFESFLRFTGCHREVFEILKSQFSFAVENLYHLDKGDDMWSPTVGELGRHLFIYYLWGVYPLRGGGSPLERFYQETVGQPEHWSNFFRQVGFILKNAESLDDDQEKE